MFSLLSAFVLAAFVVFGLVLAFAFRRVVKPNEVHIVQSTRKSVAYGVNPSVADEVEGVETLEAGNSYYAWPTWIPRFGVQVIKLPLSVFDEDLRAYDAYDIGKVPFVVDVVAFFRIAMPTIAAQRITDLKELKEQLRAILQGAVRTVLAQHDIEQIMLDRSTFGNLFTELTKDQLAAWGVVNVKNIELMDIRDPEGEGSSRTVTNIMAKKQSLIEKESRTEVANNKKDAKVAEIAATQIEEVRQQEKLELVGRRTAEKDQEVGIANQKAHQQIQSEAKITREREMDVLKVQVVRQAEIDKEALIVAAAQDKETTIIKAEGQKQRTIELAEGVLGQQKREAEGKLAVGTAEAEAKRLAEMAVVSPQIALAQEIGENEGYQTYLVQIRDVEMNEAVGIEQAKALQAAGIKVIATTGGGVSSGVSSIGDLFTAKGGTAIGAAVEGLANTPAGARVLDAIGVGGEDTTPASRGNGAAA